ncbi:MAG: hypothetical protein KIT44_02755 [Opitutaceae bacterium]|nr:hypothetical protein [Opitutaceae bacterium]
MPAPAVTETGYHRITSQQMKDHADDKIIPSRRSQARQKQNQAMHRHYPPGKRRKTGLSKRIEDARRILNLSQPEAAKEWGVNVRTLQDWELGRNAPRGFARAQLEKLLAEILGPAAATGKKPPRAPR